ncbi:diguanylate cyclase [Alisedimentitalea sp. MJ-SS2]|uniref:diguanylate cyclase domain-containing protein n=1 Tax=Aliisedimentitalea sp. MJ-SS2 TaxID=3049795 RepID=UPI002908EE74|nr:diguanylate cyclase [Alisedimentitalea sp. MJ-SS2]MDU8927113.1 diguanylate cyclase [Alisedimentitalea sp. MJ-SS2]
MDQIDAWSPIFDTLCPMHVIVDDSGHILHAGPTLQKLRPDEPMAGQRFLELFELRRPRDVRNMGELLRAGGLKLQLRFREGRTTALKGVLMPLPGDGMGCAVVNLSFGISILDAVRDYELLAADFPATDLTIEMLYLVEAKSAAMDASRKLNTQLQSAMIAAEEQAFTDTLTGLKNRRAMDHVLERMIESGRPFAVMYMDLDFFKAVNDTMGHAAGDHVLQQVARIMVEETRQDDTVARVGGDEFVLLFDGLIDRKRLDITASRLIKQLERPIAFGDQTAQISASAGTVLSSHYDRLDAAQMLGDADLALYASKHKGRACHTFFSPQMREDEGGSDRASGRT